MNATWGWQGRLHSLLCRCDATFLGLPCQVLGCAHARRLSEAHGNVTMHVATLLHETPIPPRTLPVNETFGK